ncbi:MAG: peptide deformylase [Acidimicrobiales bacterium]
MTQLGIRIFGDPVLRNATPDISEIDSSLVRLVGDMIDTMHDAPGVGLAATQVGVQKRVFVYDVGDGAKAVVNPRISEARGEWTYEEGCLSLPGLSWSITRPNEVHLEGMDLDGNEISIDAGDLLGRVFQHEVDHLDGVLLLERLDEDQRKEAMRVLREMTLDPLSGRRGAPA